MARILIRAGKDPFTAVVPETTLTQDVFNSNSGNYLFQHSVWKALDVAPHELVANSTLSERRAASPDDAARINEEFDHFVIPMANSFRPDFADKLENLTRLIEQLTIPTTVIGIGAQAPADRSFDALADVRDVTQRFVTAVLDRSASIGVRGEFTRDFLVHLGFPADSVDVIGCPSLFLHGPDHQVHRKVESLGADSALGLNLTPEVPGIGAFATEQAARHPNLTYVGQDQHDLRLLLWGVTHPHVTDPLVPAHLRHPLYQQDRMRLFVDTWTWYDFLAQQEFVYGTRFHGNVAALLAGTPAMMLAHDSRTLELAEYHRMPHRLQPHFDSPISVEELYEATDLTAFNAAMPERFSRYAAFLERNGLEHRWQPGRDATQFDTRLAEASFPPAVHTLAAPDLSEVASRLEWLRHASVIDLTRHPQRYEYPFNTPTYQGAGTRHARLGDQRDAKLKRQQERIDDLTARLVRLETMTLRGFLARVARKARSLLRRG
ncbi:polysaccharide pyruvyl transferase family protein [Aeromicrobium duanguangcaii]|uniref:Polysaccharide pyruvyl transferase family protein n=1 Tax=Aeromicrobium duanguangcaii TaxID=2968086 RepID=A0ABY5KG80_9ACTN|nr:polysaccharide pyruvyl transferase family protein [Aeromicrobium duanguangcaii]MCD9154076.1 polysaccharide pyruvyl transferase family protein [Aeromicrobium duanguangcaii]UUI68850.1 polysaccharide pyruvyl transferase family protein [Aeromicrobium duanguangcaii]